MKRGGGEEREAAWRPPPPHSVTLEASAVERLRGAAPGGAAPWLWRLRGAPAAGGLRPWGSGGEEEEEKLRETG